MLHSVAHHTPENYQRTHLGVAQTLQRKEKRHLRIAGKGKGESKSIAQLQAYHVLANSSQKVTQLKGYQDLANRSKRYPVQMKVNHTGLPDHLRSGIENLSGYAMDDVKVHYNSSKPAQLNAYAYAQGSEIHLASGQEKHLPHEAWHVVQQKQGRVKPTLQMKGKVNINDDVGLEKEADHMGNMAQQHIPELRNRILLKNQRPTIALIQRYVPEDLGGALDERTYEKRAAAMGRGFNGLGAANRGWARVIDHEGEEHVIDAESIHGAGPGAGHTEELLLRLIRHRFGDDVPMRNPAVAGHTRITQIYTERRPCGAADEAVGAARASREATGGSCHAMLLGLHPDIPVSFSVPNTEAGHGQLMDATRRRFINEIVADQRRVTYRQMTSLVHGRHRHPLETQIRTRNRDVHGAHQYGRSYERDFQDLTQAITSIEESFPEYHRLGGLIPLDTMRTNIREQFMGAHAAGSDPIRTAIQGRRDHYLGLMDAFITTARATIIDKSTDGKDDEGPAPPPSSAGATGAAAKPMAGSKRKTMSSASEDRSSKRKEEFT